MDRALFPKQLRWIGPDRINWARFIRCGLSRFRGMTSGRRERERGERERETTGYEPFALHAPIQWAMLGVCDSEKRG